MMERAMSSNRGVSETRPSATGARSTAQSAGTTSPVDPKPRPATDIYYVVGPGSLRHNGTTYSPHDLIELAADAAKTLGTLVAKGEPPKPPPDPSKRGDGKYVVAGPGILRHNGDVYRPGDAVQLSANEARTLGSVVREP